MIEHVDTLHTTTYTTLPKFSYIIFSDFQTCHDAGQFVWYIHVWHDTAAEIERIQS